MNCTKNITPWGRCISPLEFITIELVLIKRHCFCKAEGHAVNTFTTRTSEFLEVRNIVGLDNIALREVNTRRVDHLIKLTL
ncbi:hypothetical protein D3C86_1868650 [compost metagenome]